MHKNNKCNDKVDQKKEMVGYITFSNTSNRV